MKQLVVAVCLVLAGLGGAGVTSHHVALAATGGYSDAAHMCEQSGYLTLFRVDGTGFKTAGECTSYAAHGGQFSSGIAACAVGSNSGCITLSNVTLDALGVAGYTGSYTLTGVYNFSPTQTSCTVQQVNQCAPSTGGGTYTTSSGDAGTFTVSETINTKYGGLPCSPTTVEDAVVLATFTSTRGYPSQTFYLVYAQGYVYLYSTNPINLVYELSSTSTGTATIAC